MQVLVLCEMRQFAAQYCQSECSPSTSSIGLLYQEPEPSPSNHHMLLVAVKPTCGFILGLNRTGLVPNKSLLPKYPTRVGKLHVVAYNSRTLSDKHNAHLLSQVMKFLI